MELWLLFAAVGFLYFAIAYRGYWMIRVGLHPWVKVQPIEGQPHRYEVSPATVFTSPHQNVVPDAFGFRARFKVGEADLLMDLDFVGGFSGSNLDLSEIGLANPETVSIKALLTASVVQIISTEWQTTPVRPDVPTLWSRSTVPLRDILNRTRAILERRGIRVFSVSLGVAAPCGSSISEILKVPRRHTHYM